MLLKAFSRKYTMASTTKSHSSPFSQAVVRAVRKLYPEQLADKSFDNTGLLWEAPHRPNNLKNSVLLTIDLTTAVADEAIARKNSIVIAYHPIIFRGLKSFTLANTQQTTLMRLAQEGISVYSPHTAVDAAPGGLNDWLVDVIVGRTIPNTLGGYNAGLRHERSVITPVPDVTPYTNAGYGRIVRLVTPTPLGALLSNINSPHGLGLLPGLSVAVPQSIPAAQKSEIPISSIGICAGSGAHMLAGLDVDLWFTGEVSHHEALAAIEQGKVVVTAFHSNTERGFLRACMREKLSDALAEEIVSSMGFENGEQLEEEFEVVVSDADRDPFEIVTRDFNNW